jgi:two-component system chemotaxis response regulator CheB
LHWKNMKIIVVGGSIGGLEALKRIAAVLPSGFPSPMMVVLHPSDHSPTMLASIVGRNSALNVSFGEEGDQPRPGQIYIARPELHLVVRGTGALGLEEGLKVRHGGPAINRLFETAAQVYTKRAIGLVLSGANEDGADGLAAVKAHGGISIVQSPSDAQEPSMPTNALLRDSPDHVLLIEQIGPLLMQLVAQRTGHP